MILIVLIFYILSTSIVIYGGPLTGCKLLNICFYDNLLTMSILDELKAARKEIRLNQQALAARAGLSRMTVQRIEAQQIDPRLSTLLVIARALGMDLMLVPAALRPALQDFVRSGGRLVGQEQGIGAPPSIVNTLEAAGKPGGPKGKRKSDA